MADKQVVICLEGTIAAGKTTVLRHLSHFQNYAIFPEQVDKWTRVPGSAPADAANLLDLFYQNQEKYAYHFQSLALLTQFENHAQYDPSPVKIIERSAHSSFQVFAALLHENHALTTLEHDLLRILYKQLLKQDPCHVDYYIYLDVPPTAARIRLEKRGRHEEKTGQLTTAYLNKLQTNYEYFLESQQAPVFRVNGLQPTSIVLHEVTKILHSIHPFGPQTLPSGSDMPTPQET
jgi:deoxyadenosine/deoxycytidine kinase